MAPPMQTETNHQESELSTVAAGLIVLMFLSSAVVGAYLVWVWTRPPLPGPPVAQIAIIDCSPSMICPNNTYFDQALGITDARVQDPRTGLVFSCPSSVEIYQIANSLGVQPFSKKIDAPEFGFGNVFRCRGEIRDAREKLKTWVHSNTAGGRPSETNLLELSSFYAPTVGGIPVAHHPRHRCAPVDGSIGH